MLRHNLRLLGLVVLLAARYSLATDLAANLPPEQSSTCRDPQTEKALNTAMMGFSKKSGPATLLALSGGGQFGAFGAGFLQGWHESTNEPARPDPFDMVTGTSTGSLIATFAFLGTTADDQAIVDAYTSIKHDSDVFSHRFFLTLLWKDSLTTRTQFRRRLEQVITTQIVKRVAEQAKTTSRRLLVGATDIETGCFHYFDLTELSRPAADPNMKAAEIERIRQAYIDRLMASTAIPVQFPPVEIQEAGQQKTSTYVDGGLRRNLFIEPLILAAAEKNVALRVFIIINGARGVDVVDRKDIFSGIKILNLATRSEEMLLDESTEGNLFRVFLQIAYAKKKVTGEILLTDIPPSVSADCNVKRSSEDKLFNHMMIECLASHGAALGRLGTAWVVNDPFGMH